MLLFSPQISNPFIISILLKGQRKLISITSNMINLVHPIILLFLCSISSSSIFAQNTKISVNVGVVLDMETSFGKMGMSCINMSLSDFYAARPKYKTRLVLHLRDSKSDVVGAAAAGIFSHLSLIMRAFSWLNMYIYRSGLTFF